VQPKKILVREIRALLTELFDAQKKQKRRKNEPSAHKKKEKKYATKTRRKNEYCDDDYDVFVVQHQHQQCGATESERALV